MKKISFKNFEYVKICIFFALIIFCNHFLFQLTIVNGNSMYPTLKNHQIYLLNRMQKSYNRNEIVVFKSEQLGKFLIKRVIGLPGETVQIIDGEVYINKERLSEIKNFDIMEKSGVFADAYTLKEDEYFVLGDNRNHSGDSRAIGAIKSKDIVGKICFPAVE